MSWFPDMGTDTDVDFGDHIRAVGWLSVEQPYTKGEVPPGFVARLQEFAEAWYHCSEALNWPIFMGGHECELCDRFYSSGNFAIPAGDLLFVAPEMLPHYVEAHGYRPPDEFIAAVMNSPLPNSKEYAAAIAPFRLPDTRPGRLEPM